MQRPLSPHTDDWIYSKEFDDATENVQPSEAESRRKTTTILPYYDRDWLRLYEVISRMCSNGITDTHSVIHREQRLFVYVHGAMLLA